MTAFFRLMWKSSAEHMIMFSKTAMTVEKLAKVMKRKNKEPQKRPPAMCINTLGSVMKIRDGPASGCTPKEKHAGKIIRPEVIATMVSRMQIPADSPGSVTR